MEEQTTRYPAVSRRSSSENDEILQESSSNRRPVSTPSAGGRQVMSCPPKATSSCRPHLGHSRSSRSPGNIPRARALSCKATSCSAIGRTASSRSSYSFPDRFFFEPMATTYENHGSVFIMRLPPSPEIPVAVYHSGTHSGLKGTLVSTYQTELDLFGCAASQPRMFRLLCPPKY